MKKIIISMIMLFVLSQHAFGADEIAFHQEESVINIESGFPIEDEYSLNYDDAMTYFGINQVNITDDDIAMISDRMLSDYSALEGSS